MRRPRRFFLAVHGVERDDAVSDLQFAEQLLGCGDLIGLCLDVDMGQDQAGFDVESVQHLGRLAIIEIVEASPECLAIERDGSPRRIGCGILQSGGVAAEHPLDLLWIETLKDVADRGMGGRTLPVQAEGGVQPATVHLDEGLDRAEGIAAGDHG